MAAVHGWSDENGVLLDYAAIAPSPCKDYCQILVTHDVIIYRCWKVSLRNDSKLHPTEVKQSYEDFLLDDRTQGEIRRTLGLGVLGYVKRLAEGRVDYLPRLPPHLLINIVKLLPLEDIGHVALTCKQFNTLCHGEELWREVYAQHCGGTASLSRELTGLAASIGWKRLFFTNKLQLQMQLRRLKRRSSDDDGSSPLPPLDGASSRPDSAQSPLPSNRGDHTPSNQSRDSRHGNTSHSRGHIGSASSLRQVIFEPFNDDERGNKIDAEGDENKMADNSAGARGVAEIAKPNPYRIPAN